jgi:hypothetical protein
MLTGCGDQRGYQHTSLKGKVTLDGNPIEHGTISFVPGEAMHGTGGNGRIVNGGYKLAEVPLGTNAFMFTASVETGKFVTGPGGQKEPERFNLIPMNYRTEGVVREIKDGAPQDFELQSE